ncbi:hypothetical protein GCM10011414_11570 [Croceivirga lutea]|uniref:M28 family peptidase n=1 Tax=Croceivirga lutea TaxID=1775167 RepID=UPI00163B5166|nr:M28 family peptidase [Croceivirga lutea]GGG43612.1 hypothetical protein GCM10011414_11570 [Croceivirga lutea]
MKKILLAVTLGFLACNSSQKSVTENSKTEKETVSPIVYANTITETELKEHLYTYASDEFEGRNTGSKGQKLAVEYLKNEYESLNIQPAQEDGDYFQDVPLEISKVPTGTIVLNGKEYKIGTDFITFSSMETSLDKIVYANFGIETDGYSDYSTIDVTNKVVLINFGEPKNTDGTYVISGTALPSKWGNFNESLSDRLKIAYDKGAKGILLIKNNNYSRLLSRFEYIANSSREILKLATNSSADLPMIMVNQNLGNQFKKIVGSATSSKEIEVDLDLNIKSGNKKINSENVVAFLKGNELPEEYVVISSHLDHIGISNDGQINNGADDDGSGTVALLEIAEAFKKAADEGNGPKRSIVFLHVTGEEKGLLGSKYYTDFEPIFPLEKTVANLNIDMIGRIDPNREGDRNYIYLIGSDKLSTELHELSEEVNSKYAQLELDYTYNDENDPNRFYYRSDHYNFAKNNIPIIFYFNGTHEDYHRPGDTPDKINYDLLQNRTRLVFHTAWEVANRANKIVVDKPVIN